MRSLVWFRGKDLRIADHGPLLEAAASGEVIPLFVVDPFFFTPERAQRLPHRMQFLLESLASLQANLRHLGSDLLLVPGRSVEVVADLAQRWKVDQVLAHRWTEPFGRERDRRIAGQLAGRGIDFRLFEGETLIAPGSLTNQAGRMFAVFTPFARAFQRDVHVELPLPTPANLPPLPREVLPELGILPDLEALGLGRNPRLQAGGERAARARMARFLSAGVETYGQARDRMDHPEGTSRLSADLKFGTLSIRTLWQALSDHDAAAQAEGTQSFRNELLWREFSHHQLWDRPDLLEHPFRPAFEGFPWQWDEALWEAWCEGRTGYPVVDAAARQLLAEGYVHNRARMISASFLTKDLHISYQAGEAHYLRWLTDGDWAQNNAGWQWGAGSGCDAQPWFRIFNPTLQGERFDPTGAYVRTWVPELAGLPDRWLHQPWKAPSEVLTRSKVRLGSTYPTPIVEHSLAREQFLTLAKSHLGRS